MLTFSERPGNVRQNKNHQMKKAAFDLDSFTKQHIRMVEAIGLYKTSWGSDEEDDHLLLRVVQLWDCKAVDVFELVVDLVSLISTSWAVAIVDKGLDVSSKGVHSVLKSLHWS